MHVQAEQITRISRAPSHLLITLKRFKYDFRSNVKSKILKDIDYPVCFRLPVTSAEKDQLSDKIMHKLATLTHSSSQAWNEQYNGLVDDECFPLYCLYAVIVHSGSSANSGHYYCFARGLSCGVVVWCGVVWCGVVWCGVVWCGVVWCGVVWCGVVCGVGV